MRNLAFILFLLASTAGYPQHRADIWYFGQNAGLSFGNDGPLPVYGSQMVAQVGCATICDTNGQLLFYTNGRQVWDKENNIMPNGDSIFGGSFFVNQNSVVIPHSGNDHIYFLFTIDTLSTGLSYSEIDMTLNNGLGDVSVKNNNVHLGVAGKITAVNHCNSKYFWVITRELESVNFYSYLVTDTGGVCKTPVISSAGDIILADIGIMKSSPAGNMVALPVNNSDVFVELFDFDNSTGVVSNPRKIYKTEDVVYAYGVEFSGDGNFLYISTGGKKYELIQYDLTSCSEQAINESAVKISTGNMYSIQLGPDSRIYVARVNDNYLSVIEYPGRKGEDCVFKEKEIFLGDNICLMGLPNFNQSYFYFPAFSYKNACVGDTAQLWLGNNANIDSVRWEVNQADIDTIVWEQPFTIKNVFTSTGEYGVNVKLFHCGSVDTISGHLAIHRAPDLDLGNDTTISEGSTIILDAGEGMEHYLWNTGDESQSIIIWDTGYYYVEVSKDKCIASDTVIIYNIPANVQFPTAFSPNGDGVNDIFLPRVTGVVSDYQIEIYDRYGQRVWQNTDINIGWTGEFKSKKCQADVYLWQIIYRIYKGDKSETVEKTGNVTLIR